MSAQVSSSADSAGFVSQSPRVVGALPPCYHPYLLASPSFLSCYSLPSPWLLLCTRVFAAIFGVSVLLVALIAAVTARDVGAPALIKAFSAHLKRQGKMTLPNNLDLQKTAKFKELAPYDSDFFYIRAAALARRLYLYNNQGVGHFATTFGGQQRRGTRTNKFGKGFTGVNRRALQELAKIGIVKVDDKNGYVGPVSMSFLSLPRHATQASLLVTKQNAYGLRYLSWLPPNFVLSSQWPYPDVCWQEPAGRRCVQRCTPRQGQFDDYHCVVAPY